MKKNIFLCQFYNLIHIANFNLIVMLWSGVCSIQKVSHAGKYIRVTQDVCEIDCKGVFKAFIIKMFV